MSQTWPKKVARAFLCCEVPLTGAALVLYCFRQRQKKRVERGKEEREGKRRRLRAGRGNSVKNNLLFVWRDP